MGWGSVAVLVENDYQDMEVWVPLYRLREEGHRTVVVGPSAKEYVSKHGYPIVAELASAQLSSNFSCVMICGTFAAKRKPGGVLSRQPSTIRSVGVRYKVASTSTVSSRPA